MRGQANHQEAYEILRRSIGNEWKRFAGHQYSAYARRHRPWWVCCFGFTYPRTANTWVVRQLDWKDDKRYIRLLMVKTFATLTEAQNSRSNLRGYRPFNSPDAIVTIMHSSSVHDSFTQFTLGNDVHD